MVAYACWFCWCWRCVETLKAEKESFALDVVVDWQARVKDPYVGLSAFHCALQKMHDLGMTFVNQRFPWEVTCFLMQPSLRKDRHGHRVCCHALAQRRNPPGPPLEFIACIVVAFVQENPDCCSFVYQPLG